MRIDLTYKMIEQLVRSGQLKPGPPLKINLSTPNLRIFTLPPA